MTSSAFLYSSYTIHITFILRERLVGVKEPKGHVCRSCPCSLVVKWEEPCIVTGNAGFLPALLLALGDQIGESCHCPGPLTLSVQWGGYHSWCSIWVNLRKVACKSKQWSSMLSCSLYGEPRNSRDAVIHQTYLLRSTAPGYIFLLLWFVFFQMEFSIFFNQMARDLKTINRNQ